jgi:hypothetical protein
VDDIPAQVVQKKSFQKVLDKAGGIISTNFKFKKHVITAQNLFTIDTFDPTKPWMECGRHNLRQLLSQDGHMTLFLRDEKGSLQNAFTQLYEAFNEES